MARRLSLQKNPAFPAAIRQTAGMLLELQRGRRILNLLISDRGRLFASLFVLDLHFRRHEDGIGLTPGRLKHMCKEQGICSATRAGAALTLMKLGGYVETAPEARDRRIRELVPTEKLIVNLRSRWRCHLAPAAPLLSDAARAVEMLGQPGLVQGIVRLISAHYCAGFRYTDHTPALRLFADRNGGLMVLFSILASHEVDDLDSEPAMPISISQLARSIGSSRAHVLKLLKDAEREGALQRLRDGRIVLMAPLVDDLRQFFALNYLFLTHFAKVTLDHLEASGRIQGPRYHTH